MKETDRKEMFKKEHLLLRWGKPFVSCTLYRA